jgi:hypothetical protein
LMKRDLDIVSGRPDYRAALAIMRRHEGSLVAEEPVSEV